MLSINLTWKSVAPTVAAIAAARHFYGVRLTGSEEWRRTAGGGVVVRRPRGEVLVELTKKDIELGKIVAQLDALEF